MFVPCAVQTVLPDWSALFQILLDRHFISKIWTNYTRQTQSLRLQVFAYSSCSDFPALSLSRALSLQSLYSEKWEGQSAFVRRLKLFKVSPHEYTQTVTLQLIRRLFIQQGHQPYKHTLTQNYTANRSLRTHQHTATGAPCSLCLSALCHLVDTQTLSPCVNTEQRRRFRSVSLLYSRAVTWLHSSVRAIDTEQIWPHKRRCRCLSDHLNLQQHCRTTSMNNIICCM